MVFAFVGQLKNRFSGVEARCFWLKQFVGVCTRFVRFVRKLIFKV
jgi:hypothetical protein